VEKRVFALARKERYLLKQYEMNDSATEGPKLAGLVLGYPPRSLSEFAWFEKV
jgi:hypothetical protein